MEELASLEELVEELASLSISRVFESVCRHIGELFAALFQHNLVTLMSRRPGLNALKSMTAKPHNGLTHT